MKTRCGVMTATVFLASMLSARAESRPTGGAGKPPELSGAYENFSDAAWASLGRGAVWKVVATNEVAETDPDEPWKNNGFFRKLDQGGTMLYEFDVQVAANKGGAGMFVMGRDPQAVEHGDSYLVYFSAGTAVAGKPGAVCIGKFVKDKPSDTWSPKFALPTPPNQWVSLKIQFTTATGEFVVWANGKEIGRVQDKSPIATGNHVSLHSFGTAAKFRRLRIERHG